MSETTELAKILPENVTLVKEDIADIFDEYASSGNYLPRIQLMTGNSGLVQSGGMNVGEYAFITSKDDFISLGKEVDVLVCSWRLKAMSLDNDSVVSSYDPADPNFQKIRALSDVKDSGCMCGVEFLLWVPEVNEFATYYMASKSSRSEAKKLRSFIDEKNNVPGPATLKSRLAGNKKYKWHTPVITSCSTPFTNPDPNKFLKTIEKFLNPPKDSSDVEVVEDDTNGRER